jgi:tetratricopeptide (TPR) repeat protein
VSPSGEDEQPRPDDAGEATTWQRFAAHLVAAGALTPAQLEGLRADPRSGEVCLTEYLVEKELCEPARLRQELGAFFGVEAVGPEDIPIDPLLLDYFPGDLLLRLKSVPLTLVGTTLRLAMADPSDAQALRQLRALVFASIWPVVALERDIVSALENVGAGDKGNGRDGGDTAFADLLKQAGEALARGKPEQALDILADAPVGPEGGTGGGRRLSFATVEEQQAFATEHPDREVEWVDPAFGFARYLRGVALGDLGRLEEALAELERAIEWNPVSDRAHLELGWVRARLGQLEDAVAAYARAAALYEAGGKRAAGQAHRGRGYCLAALGRTDEAVAAYRRSLKLDGGNEIAKDAIAGLTEPAGITPAPADTDLARLAAATAAGSLAWEAADAPDEDRAFTCSEGGRTINISRRGRRYRLVVGDEAQEEQDGLLKRSRRLKPLYGVVARRTRVLER